jgi:antibiotic biosynthesis monooxygenase (ABM) superfamily enzyme
VRFATPGQLDAWLNSPARRDLLHEHEELVQSWEHQRFPNSFAGWFPVEAGSGQAPASWKQSMLVLVMLFPIVMLEMRFLNPLLRGLNPSLAVFIGNAISVALLAWPGMPLIIAAMNWWLQPRKNAGWLGPAGAALLAAICVVEIIALARLL